MPHNLLILAAGYATRMGELTDGCAKPLLDVAGRPMMDWVMDRFSQVPGVVRVVVVSNSKFFDDFVAWREKYPTRDGQPEVTLIEDGSSSIGDKLGAIGDLHFALEAEGLWDQDLVVVGGDNLFELPPADFVAFSSHKPAVIGTYDVGSPDEVRRFAAIETDSRGLITAFEEKPESPTGTVAGIALYAFRCEVLRLVGEYLAEGNNPDQAGHLIAWLRGRVDTFGYPVRGKWFDVGSVESLAEADRVFRTFHTPESGCVDPGSRT